MSKDKGWTAARMGDQAGRVAIVTGANSGIGFEAARALARHGARVVLACRSEERGRAAAQRISDERPAGSAEFESLDLSSLDSVREFAARFVARNDRLDLLINNAGVMMPPLSQTADGFELQIGTNHLGHFALTGLLLDLLLKSEGSRVVCVASAAHRWGEIDLDDLHWESKKYRKMASYGQSKLANLLFTYELQRRLEAAGTSTIAVAAHPGWSATNLQQFMALGRWLNPLLAQTPEQGAWPMLLAATGAEVRGGEYFGPSGWQELKGPAVRVESNAASHDRSMAERLWARSEALTGVRFDALEAPAEQATAV